MAKKILLIEYEPRYLDRIRGCLAGKDFDLVVAKDGDEGLDAYRKSRPDLVLISSVLPKLRTQDVIRGMQAGGPTPPILLMMSGYKGKNRQADAQRIGANSILEKPFSDEAFLDELQTALGSAPPPFEASGPLLSSDDIFSDVLSGMEDSPAPAAAPVTPGTDPGIQKKLEQTLSGILPGPKRAASSAAIPKPSPAPAPAAAPGPERTIRLDVSGVGLGVPVPKPEPKVETGAVARAAAQAAKVDSSVDRMLSDTLSGLKVRSAEKPAHTTPAPGVPRPAEKPAPAAAPPVAPPAPKPAERPAPALKPSLDLGVSGLGRPAAKPPEPKPAPKPAAPAPAPVAPAPAPAPAARVEPKKAEPARRDRTDTVVPGASFGRYQLLEKIASGGMAEVYKARMRGEEGFEKIVAIKRILPHMADNDDFITMFIDEAKLAAQLTHNNIIHIYDLGKVEAYHFIAMEFVDGKDLRSILKLAADRAYPLPTELALFVASKIANALDYAHRRMGPDGQELNLVHRDVSPQNILISFEGDIKLCDFGIAKATTKVSQTQTGALKGKLQYMSPEQAWGKKIDRRTDIFSLGIVLFEMLTGERLFTGDTDLTILEQVRDARVVAPSTKNTEVPKKVDQIVLKALAKDAKDRYQNASELEKDINSVLYSFQPAPGPADLAIYMHRLLETQAPVSDDQIDAAFASAAAAPAPEPQKKGKGLVISKKAPAVEKAAEPAPAPAPPIEVSQPSLHLSPAEPAKSRTGLYAGIGVAAVVLVAVVILVVRGKGGTGPAPAPTAVPVAAAPTAGPQTGPSAVPTEPERVVDPKAVEAEAKRLAALEAEKLRQAARQTPVAAAGVPTVPAKAAPAGAPTAVSLSPSKPLEPPRAAEPTKAPAPEPTATPVPARPTEVVRVAEAVPPKPAVAQPTAPPAVAPAVPPPSGAPLREGDLVGPGEGVVEPRIVRLGSYKLPPQARQISMKRGSSDQGLGTPVIMALVTEKGAVTDTRVLRPSAYSFVDEAAVQALKGATIEPATKNGVKVKMWKAFPITVRP